MVCTEPSMAQNAQKTRDNSPLLTMRELGDLQRRRRPSARVVLFATRRTRGGWAAAIRRSHIAEQVSGESPAPLRMRSAWGGRLCLEGCERQVGNTEGYLSHALQCFFHGRGSRGEACESSLHSKKPVHVGHGLVKGGDPVGFYSGESPASFSRMARTSRMRAGRR